jgi:hypothetical protein
MPSAVSPRLLTASTRAPASSSIVAIAIVIGMLVATLSGAVPSLSALLTSAPASTSALTTCPRPVSTASHSAVLPFRFATFTSAPAAARRSTSRHSNASAAASNAAPRSALMTSAFVVRVSLSCTVESTSMSIKSQLKADEIEGRTANLPSTMGRFRLSCQ